jgi:transcriptional regulator with XRE-family HTH domain
MQKTFGEFLREQREKKNISLRETARLAKVSPAFLSDVEWGRRFPADPVLKKLATVLSIPEAELHQYDNRPPITELRDAMRRDPAMGVALRSVIKSGVTSKDILKFIENNQKTD